jgi:hypothetical protein
MRGANILVAIALNATFSAHGRAEESQVAGAQWSPEQARLIAQRLSDREPFLKSREAGLHADSLNLFLERPDYAILRGNPLFGYWAEGTFRWAGSRVAWDGIRPVSQSAKPITRRAWNAAFAYIARKHGLTIDRNAPIRVHGACIGAVLDPNLDEPNRGVVLELRIDSPTGPFLYWFGMGKPTIEDAIGASLDWAVSFARTINQEPTPPGVGGR